MSVREHLRKHWLVSLLGLILYIVGIVIIFWNEVTHIQPQSPKIDNISCIFPNVIPSRNGQYARASVWRRLSAMLSAYN